MTPAGEPRRKEWLAERVPAARPVPDGSMCLADGVPVDPESISRAIGAALAELHAVLVDDAPFDVVSPATLTARAVRRADSGLDAADGGPYRGIAPYRLGEILGEQMSGLDEGDPVVVHGSLTASTVWFHPSVGVTLTGWEGAIIGDRHLDLAMGARFLGDLYGYAVAGPFFDAYGLDRLDPLRLDTYQLLAHVLGA